MITLRTESPRQTSIRTANGQVLPPKLSSVNDQEERGGELCKDCPGDSGRTVCAKASHSVSLAVRPDRPRPLTGVSGPSGPEIPEKSRKSLPEPPSPECPKSLGRSQKDSKKSQRETFSSLFPRLFSGLFPRLFGHSGPEPHPDLPVLGVLIVLGLL